MDMFGFFYTYAHRLTRYVQVQLFITLISLPILTSWGLPCSLLTIVGNLLFAPILSLFLLLSSLIAIAQIFHLPHQFFIIFLNYITDIWLWVLALAPKQSLITLPQPPIWWCIAMPMVAVLCITKSKTQRASIVWLFCSMCIFVLYLKYFHVAAQSHVTIPCAKGTIHIIHCKGKTSVIDPGATAQLSSPANWIDNTLLQELAKKIGSLTIEQYIVVKPTIRTLQAAQQLICQATVHHMYIPYWQKDDNAKRTREFMKLKHSCAQQNCTLHRIHSNKLDNIKLADNYVIAITPNGSKNEVEVRTNT